MVNNRTFLSLRNSNEHIQQWHKNRVHTIFYKYIDHTFNRPSSLKYYSGSSFDSIIFDEAFKRLHKNSKINVILRSKNLRKR